MIIRQKQAKEHTIQSILNDYLGLLVALFVMIMLVTIGFCLTVVLESDENNKQIYELKQFFSLLDQEQDIVYNVLLRDQTEKIDELWQNCQQLKELQEELETKHISVEYQRGIYDISILLEKYEAGLKNIGLFTEMEIYREAKNCYDAIKGHNGVLSEEILKKGSAFINRMLRWIVSYLVTLLATMILIVIYIVRKNFEILKGIVKPLQVLTNHFGKINFLKESIPEEIWENEDYHCEINQMIYGYNQMVKKNQLLLAEHYELMNTKLLLQKQELAKLQHQINPHFLFNTLNMISQTAYLENDKKVVALLETTASLLRYSLDYSSRDVTLWQEMEAVRNYITIQKQRFGERISFAINLDERVNHLKMPSLLVQPLIENAIIHGLGTCEEDGKIWIDTILDTDHNRGLIRVSDNGNGIEQEHIQQIAEKMCSREDGASHIGLANVYFRLKLYFGENADIWITSVPQEKTEVTLVLPYCEEVK